MQANISTPPLPLPTRFFALEYAEGNSRVYSRWIAAGECSCTRRSYSSRRLPPFDPSRTPFTSRLNDSTCFSFPHHARVVRFHEQTTIPFVYLHGRGRRFVSPSYIFVYIRIYCIRTRVYIRVYCPRLVLAHSGPFVHRCTLHSRVALPGCTPVLHRHRYFAREFIVMPPRTFSLHPRYKYVDRGSFDNNLHGVDNAVMGETAFVERSIDKNGG